MNTFTRKGYGRIYVINKSDIEFVKQVIKSIDEFELDYLPENYITTFDNFPKLEYTGKFDDIDINILTAICWQNGVYIFCLDNGHNNFFSIESV